MSEEKPFASYRKWRTHGPLSAEGFLVGSDLNQEWLLPWWWENYSRHNSLPVAFADFGMSPKMKDWCASRGECIRLPVHGFFAAEREEVASENRTSWESQFGSLFWDSRNAWFKKPLACLQSPFQKTAWIDLDCEVRAPLNTLFSFCENDLSFSIARETESGPPPGSVMYNSGVFVFKHGIPLILEWADIALDLNLNFYGDQEALTHLLLQKKLTPCELPHSYNWSRTYQENPEAHILHWHGAHGKVVIAHQIQSKNLQSLHL